LFLPFSSFASLHRLQGRWLRIDIAHPFSHRFQVRPENYDAATKVIVFAIVEIMVLSCFAAVFVKTVLFLLDTLVKTTS